MWKEASAAAGQGVEGLAIDDVIHVGRSWFRMSSAVPRTEGNDDEAVARPISVTKTARLGEIVVPPEVLMGRSLFESALSEPAPEEQRQDVGADKPPRTVTVSWWGLGILGASLLLTGATVTALMVRPRASAVAPAQVMPAQVVPAPVVSAPVVSVPVAPAPAPAVAAPPPATVEPLVAAPAPRSPPSEALAADESAPVARPAIVRRPTVSTQRLRTAPPPPPPKREAPPAATEPDPFAPRAKKAWVDPFAD
jgi:hypothetical protein